MRSFNGVVILLVGLFLCVLLSSSGHFGTNEYNFDRHLSGTDDTTSSGTDDHSAAPSIFGGISHLEHRTAAISLVIVVGVVIVLEHLFHEIHTLAHDTPFADMISAIEKELMIVGSMALCFKILIGTTSFISADWLHPLEFADVLVPVTSFMFCVLGFLLIIQSIKNVETWRKAYHLHLFEILDEYYALYFDEEFNKTPWYRKLVFYNYEDDDINNPPVFSIYTAILSVWELLVSQWYYYTHRNPLLQVIVRWIPYLSPRIYGEMEFRILHSAFCEAFHLQHNAIPFDEYVRRVTEKEILNFITIDPGNWVVIVGLGLANYYRRGSFVEGNCDLYLLDVDDHSAPASGSGGHRLLSSADVPVAYADCVNKAALIDFFILGMGILFLNIIVFLCARFFEFKIMRRFDVWSVPQYAPFLQRTETVSAHIKKEQSRLSAAELRHALAQAKEKILFHNNHKHSNHLNSTHIASDSYNSQSSSHYSPVGQSPSVQSHTNHQLSPDGRVSPGGLGGNSPGTVNSTGTGSLKSSGTPWYYSPYRYIRQLGKRRSVLDGDATQTSMIASFQSLLGVGGSTRERARTESFRGVYNKSKQRSIRKMTIDEGIEEDDKSPPLSVTASLKLDPQSESINKDDAIALDKVKSESSDVVAFDGQMPTSPSIEIKEKVFTETLGNSVTIGDTAASSIKSTTRNVEPKVIGPGPATLPPLQGASVSPHPTSSSKQSSSKNRKFEGDLLPAEKEQFKLNFVAHLAHEEEVAEVSEKPLTGLQHVAVAVSHVLPIPGGGSGHGGEMYGTGGHMEGVFYYHGGDFFFDIVDHMMMIISFYLSLWICNYGTVAYKLATEGVYYQLLTIAPAVVSVVIYLMTVRSTCLLKAVTSLDADVLETTLEDAEAAKMLGLSVRRKILNKLHINKYGERTDVPNHHSDHDVKNHFMSDEEIQHCEQELRKLFDSIDTDNSMLLSRAELKSFLGELHISFSQKRWRQIFREMDRNYDDQISFDELFLFLFPDHDEALAREVHRLSIVGDRVKGHGRLHGHRRESEVEDELTGSRYIVGEMGIAGAPNSQGKQTEPLTMAEAGSIKSLTFVHKKLPPLHGSKIHPELPGDAVNYAEEKLPGIELQPIVHPVAVTLNSVHSIQSSDNAAPDTVDNFEYFH